MSDEIIHIIINYTDIIVYRHGKYINRFTKCDGRYTLLDKIPRPIYIGRYKVLLRLMNCDALGYFIEYNTQYTHTKANIRFFYRETDGIDKYFKCKSNNTYIFDINNQWSKIINYLM